MKDQALQIITSATRLLQNVQEQRQAQETHMETAIQPADVSKTHFHTAAKKILAELSVLIIRTVMTGIRTQATLAHQDACASIRESQDAATV